jgi:hypothetical protein
MKHLRCLAFLLILDVGVVLGGELQRYEPRPVTVSNRFGYDAEMVDLDQARRIADHFFRRFGEDERPEVYGIPEAPGLFLVSASADHRGERDFGGRFYLVRDGTDGVEELFRGRGAGDSYFLRPTFFFGEGRLLILAETGTEYTWGFDAYSLEDETMLELGGIGAAFSDGETTMSPLEWSRVRSDGSAFTVGFSSDLVLDPGTRHEWFLPRSGDEIRFAQLGERFDLVDDPDQVCFFALDDEAIEARADLMYYYYQLVPWLEKRRLAHSFQTEVPLGMIAAGGKEGQITEHELGIDIGLVLRSRDGRTRIVPGVRTDVELADEIRAFFGLEGGGEAGRAE